MVTRANVQPTDKYGPHDGSVTGTERVMVFGAGGFLGARLASAHDNASHARFVHLGSAAEYGGAPQGTSQDERTEPFPAGRYGITKLAGSELVLRARRNGADAVVLRVFDVIGPDAPESTVTGRVIRDLRSRHTIEAGQLDVWRDFIDVRDVADAVVAVALADAQLPAVLNVGTGQASLAREVAGQLFELSGQPARIVEEAQPDTVPGATWQQADTTLIGEHLGWSPKISLEQSLADSWAGPG
jgi:NDP-hexose 4-ketoreductase